MFEFYSDFIKLLLVSENFVRKIFLKFEGNFEMISCFGRKFMKGVLLSKILNWFLRVIRLSKIFC